MNYLDAFSEARHDSALVVLEGFHAFKHAMRFGADIRLAVCTDFDATIKLAADMAPDIVELTRKLLHPVPTKTFSKLQKTHVHTQVLAIARRPIYDFPHLHSARNPIVLLEDPRNFGNVGAVIRVAAAAGAGGVLVIGNLDPWNPMAVRGSAGLHFALPVLQCSSLIECTRPLIALDPTGIDIASVPLPENGIFAFGSERLGVSPEVLQRSESKVRIPMESHVSSLNLATAVAIVLYAVKWRSDGQAH